ncbi:hypothetical protein EJ04DRAFT_552172 [Polyplosphaeria fusca]|uniref:Uncharacterized protein n=1 Tax=Polyplosphaeria fusca TaxID=682080 RepID=A0A9P4R136_9PLEO|nr:hypothetical protein EJ04DRAFT_552172 [Polyplosphaeria fusca]
MALATRSSFDDPHPDIIKIEDSPSPSPSLDDPPDAIPEVGIRLAHPIPAVLDPKDPESFLRRCSGFNKKTNLRCNAPIGRNSPHAKSLHFTYLPTCHAHRDQLTYAGRCQFKENGDLCARLFRWIPPNFELCEEHQGHPDTPCYFMKLPLELRLDVFRYLLPSKPIGSSISHMHQENDPPPPPPPQGPHRANQPFVTWNPASGPIRLPPPRIAHSRRPHAARCVIPKPPSPVEPPKLFPTPLLNLLHVSRQMYLEVKDLLFSTVPFVIDIRKDGTFMCGRRLLEPRRADGTSHFAGEDAEKAAKKFIASFDWASVKNYDVHILVENWNAQMQPHQPSHWDEEVEIYDIRDYVRVAVNGILAKSRNLCKLNVRLGIASFTWGDEELIENARLLVGPFERLRNVRQPKLCGVFGGITRVPYMVNMPSPPYATATPASRQSTPLCSVPRLPTHHVLAGPGNTHFDLYREQWERWLSQEAFGLPKKPPIASMFSSFKEFYSRLSSIVPDVMDRVGKFAFLHRARVARENEDVEAFRHLRNELIEYWYAYLEREEAKKNDMDSRLSQMLDTDVYPSHEKEPIPSLGSPGSDDDCVMLDVDKMAAEGIPMQGNQMTLSQRRHYQAQQARAAAMAVLRARQAHHGQIQNSIMHGSSPATLSAQQLAAQKQIQQQLQQQQQAIHILQMNQQRRGQQMQSMNPQLMNIQQYSLPPSAPPHPQQSTAMRRTPSSPFKDGADRDVFNSPTFTSSQDAPASPSTSPETAPTSLFNAFSEDPYTADPGVGCSTSWAGLTTWPSSNDAQVSPSDNLASAGSPMHSSLAPLTSEQLLGRQQSSAAFYEETASEWLSEALTRDQDPPTQSTGRAANFEYVGSAPRAKKRRVDSGPSGYVERDGVLVIDDEDPLTDGDGRFDGRLGNNGVLWDGVGKGKARAEVVAVD